MVSRPNPVRVANQQQNTPSEQDLLRQLWLDEMTRHKDAGDLETQLDALRAQFAAEKTLLAGEVEDLFNYRG